MRRKGYKIELVRGATDFAKSVQFTEHGIYLDRTPTSFTYYPAWRVLKVVKA